MDQEEMSSILDYSSPKTSRRTTFQDELEAVINERAVRNRTSHLNTNDFNDEDDDVLIDLLKTRRKKIDMFKTSRTKSDFTLSIEEQEESIRPKNVSNLKSVLEATPPRPVPRQRAPPSAISQLVEKDGRTQTPSATSPVSHTSTPTSSQSPGNSGSDVRQDGVSPSMNTHAASLEGTNSTDFTAVEHRQGTHQLGSAECPVTEHETVTTQSHRSSASHSRSSRKARSAESRYMGMLKVLEQKGVQETAVDTADTLRATVYQDWLKKKEEKFQVTFRAKKQERNLKEDKKTEEEMSKKAEAKASYEAWREKKRVVLREKIKEKQETMTKVQKEKDDKEKRKETAKMVFEKWKREHDEFLHEQHQKQVQTEKRLKEKEEKVKEERKRENCSSFTQWSVRKKEVIGEKLKSERRMKEIKEMEEKYEKEERDKTAQDTYQQWLRKKEKQAEREKKKKAIVVNDAPPAWSPPNRTVPFRK